MTDFSTPQRQSPIGVLVMFFDTVRQFARAFWPIALLYVFREKSYDFLVISVGVFGFIAVAGIAAYLKYLNFTFYIDAENNEFIISEGIFNKSKTAIQLEKIQQVNINQSLIQRIISVYELDVDSAGSSNKEGMIKAVSHDLALALKAKLLDNAHRVSSGDSTDANPSTAETDSLINISLLSLLKIGITSNYIRSIGLILAFFVTVYENVRQLVNTESIDEAQLEQYLTQGFMARSLLIFVVMMLLLLLVINILRTVVKFYGMHMTRQSGSLLLAYGLINKKSTILRPQRAQIAFVTRNFFQKRLDVSEIKIRQAGGGEGKQKNSIVEIPGCDEKERDAIMRLLYDVVPQKGIMLRPNIRKLIFSIFLSIVLPLGVFALVAINEPLLMEYVWIVPIYIALIGLIVYFSYRNYRLFVSEGFIIKQSGAWDVTNQIIEPAKIQAVSTSQLFWHKGLNIGSLTLHTAGGNLDFQLGEFDRMRQYVNHWLHEIETSDRNWM
ncbi:MAG: PH domain-containing protein [Flavobacterium sp.]|nr:PH domain-containing protein [Flavobacterium sp.]